MKKYFLFCNSLPSPTIPTPPPHQPQKMGAIAETENPIDVQQLENRSNKNKLDETANTSSVLDERFSKRDPEKLKS